MRSSERYHLSNFKEEPYLLVKVVCQNRFEVLGRYQTLREAEAAAKKRAEVYGYSVAFVMEARVAYTIAPVSNPLREIDFCTGEETTIIGDEA